jgi:hypothetical protein
VEGQRREEKELGGGRKPNLEAWGKKVVKR